jgi:hypothetical protein
MTNTTNNKHLLVGCSFTDPIWQTDIPWSIEYSSTHPSYIVAKAGMGIKGICTEALYYLKDLDVKTVIIILPTLWRMDIEVDEETYLCTAMVDLLLADKIWSITSPAKRKWITSGGINYDKNTEQAKIFDCLYKHQGFLVMAKEHLRALKVLINHCKDRKIQYYISAIQDPLTQLIGLDYIRNNIEALLEEVEYRDWIKFNGKFIDQYLGHSKHPTTEEHKDLCKHIINHIN